MPTTNEEITIARLERILADLEYELVRGLHQGFIDDALGADILMHDKDGKVWKFMFRLAKEKYPLYPGDFPNPRRLRLIKGGNET